MNGSYLEGDGSVENSRDLIIEKRKDKVAVIGINKPQRKNAIDADMMNCLADTLLMLDTDDEVCVVVLKGQGENFSAGGDLKADKLPGIENARARLRKYSRAIQVIQQMEKPVIAMVDGYALGGGLSLALACDVVFASTRAKFGANFLKIGLIPDMGALFLFPLRVGLGKAKELWFSADIIEAQEARELGIVNRLADISELERETFAFAGMVAQLPPMSVRITKRLSNTCASNLLNTILEMEAQTVPFWIETAEHKACVRAFVNHSNSKSKIS
jgi:2-(1,2-epoxy-1,2-dihydrophenyl)acetyl-CoA isomerase